MHVDVNGSLGWQQHKITKSNHDLFAICLCNVCLLCQVMNPQIRKGSSHARPLQHLHGNPHNQW